MTDVRLTATNPEDSSVVPVACNSRGELLVEGAEVSSNFPDGLTVGPDGAPVTTLANDGSSSFAGDVEIGGDVGSSSAGGVKAFAAGTVVSNRFASADDISNEIYSDNFVGRLNGANTSVIKSDGSASFNGSVSAGDEFTAKRAAFNFDQGQVGQVLGIYPGTGTALPSISLRADGTATFKSDVVIGSRNKQWMIVESNGLAHLVEQTREIYPPLRDIPGELTMVQEQLQKVMERLKMAPEAGWEVWDGSD